MDELNKQSTDSVNPEVEQPAEETPKAKRGIIITVSILSFLIVGGIVAGYFYFFTSSNNVEIPTPAVVDSQNSKRAIEDVFQKFNNCTTPNCYKQYLSGLMMAQFEGVTVDQQIEVIEANRFETYKGEVRINANNGAFYIDEYTYKNTEEQEGVTQVYLFKKINGAWKIYHRLTPADISPELTPIIQDKFIQADNGNTLEITGEILFPVLLDGKYGFIDQGGNLIIEPSYDSAHYFTESLGGVAIGEWPNDKWWFIDKNGEKLNDKKFEWVDKFSEGLATVKIEGLYGFIDKDGDFVVDPKFTGASKFSEGLARVFIDGYWGYIDKNETMVIEPKYPLAGDFSEGLAAVTIEDKVNYIDKNGMIVIETEFEGAQEFTEGLSAVQMNIDGESKAGFIDKTGKIVIDFKFVNEWPFSEGLAPVSVDGKYGYIDKAGEFVIIPQFDFASPFQNGLARVKVGDKIGYIDKTGKYIWEPQS